MKIHGLEFEKAIKKPSVVSQKTQENPEEHKSRERKINMKASNLILIIIIVVLGGALGWVLLGDKISLPWSGDDLLSPVSGGKDTGKKSNYQAVFLTNGQVYFGRLSGYPKGNPVLKDVYYLRAQRPLQPPADTSEKEIEVEDKKKTSKKETEVEPIAPATPELTLIKLGNELHGPVDEIQLNKDHILFVEDLREGSRIVLAIEKFRQQL